MSKIAVSNWRLRSLCRLLFTVGMLITAVLAAAKTVSAQAISDGSSDRRVVTRVEPTYPETLKRLYIGGAVRVQVLIAPNGSVEGTELLGGNPILGQSAMKAIKQWKYVPAKAQEKIVVRLEFDPHE